VNRRALFLAAIALSIATAAAAAQFPSPQRDWTIVDVGTLGGSTSNALAVSDTGIVVGCAQRADGVQHAFAYWGGVMVDLDPGGAPGVASCAYAVNNSGVVAGSVGEEAVVWERGNVTKLGVAGWAVGINDTGVVVGTFKFGNSNRAFMWKGGAIVNLGTLGGSDSDPYTRSEATAINERNQVVGQSNGRAFLWENGVMKDLGGVRADGINDRGDVVGMTSNHGPAPFIYSGGVMTVLPEPSYAGAVGINNQGVIIGSGEGIYGYVVDSAGYKRLETIPSITAKGWRHLEPEAINSRGLIVGSGMGPNDNRGFVLIPPNWPMVKARESSGSAQATTNPAGR
jgi:probable HAF family extracellular repeat protein